MIRLQIPQVHPFYSATDGRQDLSLDDINDIISKIGDV